MLLTRAPAISPQLPGPGTGATFTVSPVGWAGIAMGQLLHRSNTLGTAPESTEVGSQFNLECFDHVFTDSLGLI